jgi:hypothetical protein
LPQDVINKIQLLYRHHIERGCAELQLTVEAEEEWNLDNALIDELSLSDSSCYQTEWQSQVPPLSY